MPPKPKTAKEMELERQKIIKRAMAIINKSGLSSLTMRKLATALKMSATNIYNYFKNKDEIYLYILIDSFDLLLQQINEALSDDNSALENLEVYLRTFIQFGIQNEGRYALMFSTTDPKSFDYKDTASEPLAVHEKEIAMRSYHTLCGLLEQLNYFDDKNLVWLTAARIITEMHGAIHLHHTQIISETLNDPNLVFENVIEHILMQFQ